MADWGFYGRKEQLAELSKMFGRGRWFFANVTGRRRIGKTSLIEHARNTIAAKKPVFSVQIPDSEPIGVLSAVVDALDIYQVPTDLYPRPKDFAQLARLIEALAEAGYLIVLDEFQYFNRERLSGFTSFLQTTVDRLAAKADRVTGGLIVLGSIHTEMTALLEDRAAPLFNRVTDHIELGHWDIGSLLSVLREHADADPTRLLFLWNLFEGVPKFYRDCYEQQVLNADRPTLLRRIFFESSSPLKTEAQNWFLRELRGRYDVVLKAVARHPGQFHGELVTAVREASGNPDTQISGYLKVLCEKYRLIEGKLPVFAKPEAKRKRYYITDNFLRSWLNALAQPVSASAFRPIDQLVAEADQRLEDAEGWAVEKLAGQLYEERSRKVVGDFPLSERIAGYWDKAGVEIDLVAVNEPDKRIRFGSCKRSPSKLLSDITNFRGHVERYLNSQPGGRVRSLWEKWSIEYIGVAPVLTAEQRAVLKRHDVIPQDLNDLTVGLE